MSTVMQLVVWSSFNLGLGHSPGLEGPRKLRQKHNKVPHPGQPHVVFKALFHIGFKVQDSGFRVWGLGLRDHELLKKPDASPRTTLTGSPLTPPFAADATQPTSAGTRPRPLKGSRSLPSFPETALVNLEPYMARTTNMGGGGFRSSAAHSEMSSRIC